MSALYAEFKKIQSDVRKKERSNKNEESDVPDDIKKYNPSLADIISGYIYRYQFLDLFSNNFLYTVGDLTNETDTALLSKTLLSKLESEDIEMLRIIDLHLESDHINANPELIERAFRDLLR
jgi:hypothetical protein